MKEGNNYEGSFQLLVDNTKVAGIEEHDSRYNSPQESGTIILELAAG